MVKIFMGNQNIQSAKLSSAITLLKDAWKIYKQKLKTFLGIMIITSLVTILFVAILFIPFLLKLGTIGIVIKIILLSISIIGIVITQLWGTIALIYTTVNHEQKIGIKEAFQKTQNKIISCLWVTFLSGFIIIGGIFLFFIPGILFSIWFSFVCYILIAENLNGMDALLKSKEYVKGKFWGVLWRLIFIGLFIGLLYFFIFFLAGLLLGFLQKNDHNFIFNIISQIISIFTTPFLIIYSFLIYKNLKELKKEFVFTAKKNQKNIFCIFGILGILGLIAIFSFAVFGSLNKTKETIRDAKRNRDIEQTQFLLDSYYLKNNGYPLSLNQLNSIVPNDPETNLPYEYQLLQDGEDYKLCIKFEKLEPKKQCINSEFNLD
mgnify:FL=1